MHITRYTDLSLRVLIYVGLNRPRQVTIKEVSDKHKVSKNHLMKVVQELNQKHFLNAVRGKNGGLTLAQPAQLINLGELVRAMEPGLDIVECFGSDSECVIAPACRLKGVFVEALNSFLSVLDRYSLEDLLTAKERVELVRLLNINTVS